MSKIKYLQLKARWWIWNGRLWKFLGFNKWAAEYALVAMNYASQALLLSLIDLRDNTKSMGPVSEDNNGDFEA